ncbi:N-acetyl-gamma-glutamyl-phosphate reductase [Desulforamulus reducens MI-1]|uniref:N-acetyl-gamma-glutamyl-phosphate reductase n=1 Tax=Desulforamulus reducens (strain ATCC BAA-1160 / DSM 100696 / MI-1) TaxID=349161 RepID=ARGC_DESRM|nr:N-acetyl-gamma-glutamyl-phosphate reductase [Desulforamulus reducens]A4J167.1 RecName: Full=N-acetyl-gamma-glutamyl-phosphate reductase; Short=AGPR; AltName: Full=N-acetyl-glutamate semialdehyde dehydrogenase; Short=NAGSA dehydrogenase [Desulforamulus reducens MI-1]ABO48820.1 N-acetyl-gamma-glutamyl-phosphate reductase [Desulforamulus reducens MI-1]
MIKVGVVGATGYAGAELVRLLSRHPKVELTMLTSQTYAGKPMWEVFPHLYGIVDNTLEELNIPKLVANCDVIFTALPHGHAMPIAQEVMKKSKRLIDLGADFRLKDVNIYQAWYKTEHTAQLLLNNAVYGLPELYREIIKQSVIVANPGCYPTSVILGLAPLLTNEMVDTKTLIIDAKSGVSGAGRGLSLKTHFSETTNNFQAYGVATHRHTPEIEQELALLAGNPVTVSFTPHLTPMIRGILSTIYASLINNVTTEELTAIYRQFYQGERFVRVLPAGMYPTTKGVAGSNHCDISVTVDVRTKRVIVLSAIDNLIKGAAGQAVQNLNVMLGLPEDTALDFAGIYP